MEFLWFSYKHLSELISAGSKGSFTEYVNDFDSVNNFWRNCALNIQCAFNHSRLSFWFFWSMHCVKNLPFLGGGVKILKSLVTILFLIYFLHSHLWGRVALPPPLPGSANTCVKFRLLLTSASKKRTQFPEVSSGSFALKSIMFSSVHAPCSRDRLSVLRIHRACTCKISRVHNPQGLKLNVNVYTKCINEMSQMSDFTIASIGLKCMISC